ncbi:Sec1-like_superfamily [Hexamita inflata]|uniref:Sec1-like superfamily n=1 Tax=Hexamita inflata TaxID=28002 RepID=A0AA86V2Y7_9EUKA|nr:Sec1-like superfamily [Hexamita inflata]
MYKGAQQFLQKYLNSGDFSVLLTDAESQPLIEQLLSSEHLQKANVCIVLQMSKLNQLQSILQQNLAKVICVLSPNSAQAIIQFLNENYVHLASFRILFTSKVNLEQQMNLTQLSPPESFKVYQTGLGVHFLTQNNFTASSLDDLLDFYQSAISKFGQYVFPSKISIVGRQFTDFAAISKQLERFMQSQSLQKTNDHLIIIDRDATIESFQSASMCYGSLLSQFQHILTYIVDSQLPKEDCEKILPLLDDIYSQSQTEVYKFLNELFKRKTTQNNNSDLFFRNHKLLNCSFVDAIQLTANLIQQTNKQEQIILQQSDISQIQQHEQNKAFLNKHLEMQKFLMSFVKLSGFKEFSDLIADMKRNPLQTSKILEFLQKELKYKFMKQILINTFLLTQENAVEHLNSIQQKINTTPTVNYLPHQELLKTQSGLTSKLINAIKSEQNLTINESLSKQTIRKFDLICQNVFESQTNETLKKTFIINGKIGFAEMFEIEDVGSVE